MNEKMNRILEPLGVYLGSFTTFALAYVSEGTLLGVQAAVTLVVGVATLVYTVLKCIDLWESIQDRRAHNRKKRHP